MSLSRRGGAAGATGEQCLRREGLKNRVGRGVAYLRSWREQCAAQEVGRGGP